MPRLSEGGYLARGRWNGARTIEILFSLLAETKPRERKVNVKNLSLVRPREAWAYFRHAVVAPLLVSPPRKGELQERLRELADTEYSHPVTGDPIYFGISSIERWFYLARNSRNPVEALTRRRRKDAGQMKMSRTARKYLLELYNQHPTWSKMLLKENLDSLLKKEVELGEESPSYSTVRRYLLANGLNRLPKDRSRHRPGYKKACLRKELLETRSFEAECAQALWHVDFHVGSLPVLLPTGEWIYPQLFGCLDDCCRHACHAQWYLIENSENVAHGLTQAIQKRGVPVSLMSDNGKAFLASEITRGLERLGIHHETTLEYSPNQNGKAEAWWRVIEDQLLAMLEGVENLTLKLLNQATQAFIELKYHQAVHSELGQTPMEKYRQVKDLGRPSPSSEEIRLAFTREVTRKQRRGDGTIQLLTKRFEIPSRYRHISKIALRFAEWDLSHVYLADNKSGKILTRIFPLDKLKNADGRRRKQSPVGPDVAELCQAPIRKSRMAPLLEEIMKDHASRGIVPAYLPRLEETGGEE
jgi:transposase InsO family protein